MSDITCDEIMELIAAEFGVHPLDARPGRRRFKPSEPPLEIVVRDAAIYLTLRHTLVPIRTIGKRLRCGYVETLERMGRRCAERIELDASHASAIERIEAEIDAVHEKRSSLRLRMPTAPFGRGIRRPRSVTTSAQPVRGTR